LRADQDISVLALYGCGRFTYYENAVQNRTCQRTCSDIDGK